MNPIDWLSGLNLPITVIVLVLTVINHIRFGDLCTRLDRQEKRLDEHLQK